jgi:hypothetical protein
MEDARMNPLAQQATGAMLAAKGEHSFQLSERLRSEMEKLFAECQSQGDQAQQQELDSYLKLQRKMAAGKSFAQMRQSRKLGNGNGQGQQQGGQGRGARGSSGFAVMEGPSMGVLGNETTISKSEARQTGGKAGGQDKQNPGSETVNYDKPDVMKDVNPMNRKSGAVTTESTVEEYSDIVDQYFKTITK